MAKYLAHISGGAKWKEDSFTTQIMLPFISAMKLEGAAFMKPPCNDNPEVNPESRTCMHGSPWIQQYGLVPWVGHSVNH